MPGQRKKGKKSFTFWLTEDEKRKLEEKAQKRGITMTNILKEIIIDGMENDGIKMTDEEKKDTIVKLNENRKK